MNSTPYATDWAASALRSLDRLPETIASACVQFVYGTLAENPQRAGRALRFDLKGRHSARRGAFRVISTAATDPRPPKNKGSAVIHR